MSSHLNSEALLRFGDGELAGAARHLAECADCRRRHDEIGEGLKVYFDYRAQALIPAALPPAPWDDLRAGMAAIDRRIEARRKPQRRAGVLWRWAAAGLAAAALVAAYLGYQRIPSVEAARLLRKAAAVARPPRPGARIRVRMGRRDMVRPATVAQGGNGGGELAGLFASAGYDWATPFSAQAFAEWRGRLTDKSDRVEVWENDAGSGARVYVIRTESASNALASATLVLRSSDSLPVRETMVFRGNQTLEIAAADPEPEPAAIPAPAPARPFRAAIGLPLAVRELHALAALHSVHADLGEVEMSAADQTVSIQGAGLGQARRGQIQSALATVDGVTLSFESGAQAPAANRREVNPVKTGPEAPLRALLAAKLAGAPADETIDSILDSSDAMLAQAFALRRLADRFPPAAEAALPDGDRAALLHLRDDYSREYLRQFERLRQLLSPLAAAGPPAARSGGLWQDGAAAALAAAKSLDAALSGGFASAVPTGPPEEMLRRLQDALRDASVAAGGLR